MSSRRRPEYLTYAQWTEERFWAKIRFDQTTGCWVWIGAKSRAGRATFTPKWGKPYGTFWCEGRNQRVHRWAYKRFSGQVLDPKKDLHHKCRNTLCANWTHLEQISKKKHGKISQKQ